MRISNQYQKNKMILEHEPNSLCSEQYKNSRFFVTTKKRCKEL